MSESEEEVELTWEKLAYIQECVGGWYQGHVLVRMEGHEDKMASAFTPAEGRSREEVVQQLEERWPGINVVTKDEWDKVFYSKWGGRPSDQIGAATSGTGRRTASFATRSTRPKREPAIIRQSSAPPLNIEALKAYDLALWIPAVEAAHRLGVPPQYVYNKIYHNKLKTQGERPKRVNWGDVLRMFKPSVWQEVSGGPIL